MNARARFREEVLVVLSLSLLEPAVFSVIDLVQAPIAGEVRTIYPRVGLAEQLALIAFGLAPVWLVLHLLRRSGEGAGTIGLRADRIGADVAAGTVLAAIVGVAGVGLYLGATALGMNRVVIPVPPAAWWTVPVVVLGSVQTALFEEVVAAYLITRLRQFSWGPLAAVGGPAILRAAYHLYQGWGGFAGNLMLGVLFGAIYLRRGRLWPLIVAHALLDIGAGVGFLLFRHYLPGG